MMSHTPEKGYLLLFHGSHDDPRDVRVRMIGDGKDAESLGKALLGGSRSPRSLPFHVDG